MPRAAFLLALVTAAGVLAAPVPPDAQTEERFRQQYGTRVDERKRAKFILSADRLSVTLPAHVEEAQDPLKPPRQSFTPFDAPRVMREVSGDFVAHVGVKCPQPTTAPSRGHGLVGGGIVVVLGEGHYFSVERYHVFRSGPCNTVIWDGSFDSYLRKIRPAAIVGHFSSHQASVDPIPVRITRRGDTFTAEVSANGAKWKTLHTARVPAAEKLQVGLFTRHDLNEPVEVAFVGYTILRSE